MSEDRWDRLAALLRSEGFACKVARFSAYGGNPERAEISVRLGGGRCLNIRDAWWRKNHAVWIGWQGWVDGPDGIAERNNLRPTKSRADVARWVRSTLSLNDVSAGT